MKIKSQTVCLLAILSLLVSCATIVGGGPKQEINISSNPEGASIWTGKLVKGQISNLVDTGLKTPSNIMVPKRGTVIIVKKDGYEDTNVVLTSKVNGWFFGNIIIGGLIGSSIDVTTGSSMKFDPSNFFVELQELSTEASTEVE